jgi:hypothetical protein
MKGVVYRAFSPSRNPNIGRPHYSLHDAVMEVARRNQSEINLGTGRDDYIVQSAEVEWEDQ